MTLPLAVRGQRLGADLDLFGHLVRGERERAERAHLVVGERAAGRDHDDRLHHLAVGGVVDAVDRGFEHLVVLVESVLDLERVDVLAAADDEVALARRDEEDAVLEATEVAGADPAAGAHGLGGGGVVLPVPEHRHPAAGLDVALFAGRELGAVVVGDAGLRGGHERPDAVGRGLQHPARRPADEAGLGGAVAGRRRAREVREALLDLAQHVGRRRGATDADARDRTGFDGLDVGVLRAGARRGWCRRPTPRSLRRA